MIFSPSPRRFAKRYKDAAFRHSERLLPRFASPRRGPGLLTVAVSTAAALAETYRVRAEHIPEHLGMPELGAHFGEICDVLEKHPRERVRVWVVRCARGEQFVMFELPRLRMVAGAAQTPRSVVPEGPANDAPSAQR